MPDMNKVISIGNQEFDKIRENDYFYVDKTGFIKEWWESGDDVTLITTTAPLRKNFEHGYVEMFFFQPVYRKGGFV